MNLIPSVSVMLAASGMINVTFSMARLTTNLPMTIATGKILDMDDSDGEEDANVFDDENPFGFDSDGKNASFLDFLPQKFPGNSFFAQ